MKRKGLSLFEQHVEKVFMLVFLLAFLAVVSRQFLGGGNTVPVRSRQMSLESAFTELGTLAYEQTEKMQDETVDPNVPTEIENLSNSLLAALNSPLDVPDAGYGIPLGPTTQGINVSLSTNKVLEVQPFQMPAPTLKGITRHAGTLDPLVVSAYPALEEIVPPRQPYDVRMVSVGFQVDRESLYSVLQEAGVPENLWKGKLAVLDVQVERRLLDASGSPSESTIVPPMPGRFSIRAELEQQPDPRTVRSIYTRASGPDHAQEILHPSAYRFIAGSDWLPPTVDTESTDRRRIQQLIQQLKGVNKQIQDKEKLLQQAMLEKIGRSRAQVGGGGGRGRGGGGKRNRESDTENKQRKEAARQVTLNNQIEKLNVQKVAITKNLGELGAQVDGENFQISLPKYDPGPAKLSESDAQSVVGWSNDFTVQNGQTYQYRVRVIYTNPLFGYNNLDDDSASLADAASIESSWSAWSESITIDGDVYWFATRANEGSQQGIGFIEPACTIEMYRFYYGFWRQTEVRLHAGDTIATTLDVAALELPYFQLDALHFQQQLITDNLPVNTGAVVLDIRSAPGARGQLSVVVREARGSIRAYETGVYRDALALRQQLQESAQSAEVATILEPQGDDGGSFLPTQEQDEETGRENDSENPGTSAPRSRDGRR